MKTFNVIICLCGLFFWTHGHTTLKVYDNVLDDPKYLGESEMDSLKQLNNEYYIDNGLKIFNDILKRFFNQDDDFTEADSVTGTASIDSQAQTSSAINVSIKVVQPHETQSNLTEILLPINSDEVLMNTSPLWDIDDGTTYLVEYPNLNLFKFFDSALVSILEKSIKLPEPPLNDTNKIMKSIKTQIFPLSNSVGTINATDQLLSKFPSSTPSVKYNRTAHSNKNISNKSDIFDTSKNETIFCNWMIIFMYAVIATILVLSMITIYYNVQQDACRPMLWRLFRQPFVDYIRFDNWKYDMEIIV